MRNATRTILVAGLIGIGSAANAQTFVQYFLDGENMSDQSRGTDQAAVGDVIRMSFRVGHDGLGFAGGKVEMLYSGVSEGAIVITEDAFNFPHDPWEIGRHGILRIVISDGPADATRPHNEDVVAMGDGLGKITDVNDDFFDLASTPPGLGGLGAAFPISDGEEIFVFDYVYGGGIDLWDAGHNGRARMWRDQNDINGIEVPASSGATFVVSPAPGSIGIIVLAGAFAMRRRR